MPGIPLEPTRTQFNQIARAIDPNARVLSTRKLVGGISSRMDVLEFGPATDKTNADETRKVIIRQYYEREQPSDDRKTRFESATLQLLAENQIPAPELIIGEDEAGEILGRPAIVISYLDGVSGFRPLDSHNWARQLARAIGQVHNVELPDDLKSKLKPAHEVVRRWMNSTEPPGVFARHEFGAELWDAMRELWPDVDASADNLVHADFWNGNTVWKDEKLVAITDWEMPALGEPTSDVGYILADAAYIELDVDQTFTSAYEHATGRTVKNLLFWKMAAAVRLLPDPATWRLTQSELGMEPMSVKRRKRVHSVFFQNLLS